MQGTSHYTVYGNHIYLKYSIICRKCERYLITSLWFWIGRLCDWFRISRHTRIHLEADRAPNVTPVVFYGTRSYYVTILCLLSFLLALSLTAFFDFMTVRVTVCTLTSIRRLSLPFSMHFPGCRLGEFDLQSVALSVIIFSYSHNLLKCVGDILGEIRCSSLVGVERLRSLLIKQRNKRKK